jgi:hypothetical protein
MAMERRRRPEMRSEDLYLGLYLYNTIGQHLQRRPQTLMYIKFRPGYLLCLLQDAALLLTEINRGSYFLRA